MSRLDLDRRGRKTQLLTLGLLSQGPRTPSGVAEVMGGHVESVARRLRRYRRRGFVAVVYAREGPVYSLLEHDPCLFAERRPFILSTSWPLAAPL